MMVNRIVEYKSVSGVGVEYPGSASADFDLEQLDMHIGSLSEYTVGKAIGRVSSAYTKQPTMVRLEVLKIDQGS